MTLLLVEDMSNGVHLCRLGFAKIKDDNRCSIVPGAIGHMVRFACLPY